MGSSVWFQNSTRPPACVSAGADKLRLYSKEGPCTGRLELYHQGEWGVVCNNGWRKENNAVVCRSLLCGSVGTETRIPHYPDSPRKAWLNYVNCQGNESSLLDCRFSRQEYSLCNPEVHHVNIKCSEDVVLRLAGSRDRCAGTVQFKGQNNNSDRTICSEKWGKAEADTVCRQLGCGESIHTHHHGIFSGELNPINISLDCSGTENYLWQCVNSTSQQCTAPKNPSVICKEHKSLYLEEGGHLCSGIVMVKDGYRPASSIDDPSRECAMLHCGNNGTAGRCNDSIDKICLNCSDTVMVSIGDKGKCFGHVLVHRNSQSRPVCGTAWDRKDGEVVCRELGCGDLIAVSARPINTWGQLDRVECKGNESTLWHCLAEHDKQCSSQATVICANSVTVRLVDGWSKCSGRVEIFYSGQWESVTTHRFNNTADVVCRQLGCGRGHTKGNFSKARSVWVEHALNCDKSLYLEGGESACSGFVKIRNSNNNGHLREGSLDEKAANVVCGQLHCAISVWLKGTDSNCSGVLEVCWQGDCGGVCADIWDPKQDELVCRELKCEKPQTPITRQMALPAVSKTLLKSMHCRSKESFVGQCSLIPSDRPESCLNSHVYVMCEESVSVRLQDPSNKCSGSVEVYHTGSWHPVCSSTLTDTVKNTICEVLKCGRSTNVKTTAPYSPKTTQGLMNIVCTDTSNSLSKCTIQPIMGNCEPGSIQCTGWARMLLAGSEPCAGTVFVLDDAGLHPVRKQMLNETAAQVLCRQLQCGTLTKLESRTSKLERWWNQTFRCNGKERRIWDCETSEIHYSDQEQASIQCSENITVRLTGNCSGEVKISYKDKEKGVCDSHWSQTEANIVCRQLNCRGALFPFSPKPGSKYPDLDLHYVQCTGKESHLWQCGTANTGNCDGRAVSVACGGSIKVKFADHCGGKVELQNGDDLTEICPLKNLDSPEAELLCKTAGCGMPQDIREGFSDKRKWRTELNCNSGKYLEECFNNKSCDTHGMVYCKDFRNPGEKSPVPANLIVGLVLGALLLIAAIMLLVWISRHRRKGKRKRNKANSVKPRRSVTSLSVSEYEDVSGNEDETSQVFPNSMGPSTDIQAIALPRLPDRDVDLENGLRASATSLSDYDDTADPSMAPPLLPPREDCVDDRKKEKLSVGNMTSDDQDDYDDVDMAPEEPGDTEAALEPTLLEEDASEGGDGAHEDIPEPQSAAE
ncbi:scavenger receptor cysteine-rich type 1 protein M130 [Amia ocellicauda]|uniref:scavenger receptor cysteine-rich type 1 protein M130 n=1 Tax=Amia ocellicauda TaxID=2972642 RepID=UPI00346463E9